MLESQNLIGDRLNFMSIPTQNVRRNSFPSQILAYYEYMLQVVSREKHPNTIKNCMQLHLLKPFPSSTIRKLQDDYHSEFREEWCLNGDLNTYWANIYACFSYLVKQQVDDLKNSQLKWLEKSFFQLFEQYEFLEERIEKYPDFYQEYMEYEKARILILYYIHLNKAI